VAAFEVGDFRRARRLLTDLTTQAPSSEVVTAARRFGDRLRPDPWAVGAALAVLALLALVTSAYLL
jgi:hypothetical protein